MPSRPPPLTSGVSRMADSFTLTSMPLLLSSAMGPSFLWDLQTSIANQVSGIWQLIIYICSIFALQLAGSASTLFMGPAGPHIARLAQTYGVISASLLPT